MLAAALESTLTTALPQIIDASQTAMNPYLESPEEYSPSQEVIEFCRFIGGRIPALTAADKIRSSFRGHAFGIVLLVRSAST